MSSAKKSSATSSKSTTSPTMLRVGENIEKLKNMTLNATEFSEPMNFFMDEFAMDPAALKLGTQSKDKTVLAVFKQVAQVLHQQLNPQETPPAVTLRVVSIDQFNFFHGGGGIGNKILTFVYFKDIDQGIAGIAQLGSSKVIFSRFSAHTFAASENATFVPNSGKVKH